MIKIGTKVMCEPAGALKGYVGYLSYIENNQVYPYVIVKDKRNVGKSFNELDDLYKYNVEFSFFKLEHLTLLQDDQCQYCNLTKRELKIVQSELNDAYAMLQNRDDKIKELERKLKNKQEEE